MELLTAIAMMCAIHGGSSPASHVETYQKDCQRELATCILKEDPYSPRSQSLALLKCLKERK